MPAPDEDERPPRRQEGRGRVLLITAGVALFVIVISLRGIASFWTDYLWFESLGMEQVFAGRLRAQAGLVITFTLVFFLLMWVNLVIADRVAPTFRAYGPEEEVIERYRELVGERQGLVRIVVAAVLGLIAGAGTSGVWNEWILFRNGVDFGPETDPLFGRDIGFYVFDLPFLSFVVGWVFAAIVIVLLVTLVAHYLNGGIRLQAPGAERVTPQVRVHLSVLLGLLAVVRAVDYWLERFELTVSTRGTVHGATYTDVNAQLPATNLLILIALAAAVLFLLNIRRKGAVLPALAVGIWVVVAVVGGAIVPAAVQRFRVEPSESSREREYIERNIAATREALGLGDVAEQPFAGGADLTDADLAANGDILRNIRLWDPVVLLDTYRQIQSLRPFYRINDVDVDRYVIDGELTQVMIAARELDTAEVPQSSWEARTLAFTHGYGVVLAPANAKDSGGRPDLLVSDVPLQDEADLGVDQPGLYVGEDLSGYVIVDTNRREIDFQDAQAETQFADYEGADGINIGSYVRRAAFALRFGDLNPIVSSNLRGDSRILINRDVEDRVRALAPFLEFDADPYPVVVDGRIQWIVDGYTTTSRYPYAQQAQVEDVAGRSGLDRRFNYVRNSVKAVVDAYEGSVTMYVVEPDDPIIQTYQRAFPDLFTTDEPPEELRAHFRYPEDLFRVQSNMWGRYHISDPDDFYNNNGAWVVSRDPGAQVSVTTTTAAAGEDVPTGPSNRIDPYYLLTRLPGQAEESFVMLRPFVPFSQQDTQPVLTAFLVAGSDPDNYGQLTSYETPPTEQVDGPQLVAGTIGSDDVVRDQAQRLCQSGSSRCRYGNLVLVPIEDSLLYVQPFYIVSEQNPVPLLRQVIVAYGGEVAVGDSLREALENLPDFGQVPETLDDTGEPPDDGEPTDPEEPTDPGELDRTVAELLAEADALIAEANGLPASELGRYVELIEEARQQIQRAQELLSEETGEPIPTVPTTTSTTEPQSA
jgi:hypothetical protein